MDSSFLSIGVILTGIALSLLVVKKNSCDMTICNALGSKLFEILVGLVLPWLLKIAILEPGVLKDRSKVGASFRQDLWSVYHHESSSICTHSSSVSY